MTHQEAERRAEAYVDRVLQSQRDLGEGSEPTEEEYRRAVDRAAKALAALDEPEAVPEEDPDGEAVAA